MLHRGQEWRDTQAQLKIAFGDQRHFAVHDAVPSSFGDEGAANHMRFCDSHDAPGVEVFVYGRPGGRFPAPRTSVSVAATTPPPPFAFASHPTAAT